MKVTARIELPKKLTAKFKELKMPLSGGYEQGFEDGKEAGYVDGVKDGEEIGYEKGHADGYEDGAAELDRFWDVYQQNGQRTHYAHAFAGTGWTADTFKPKYKKITVTNGNYMFDNSNIPGDLRDYLDIEWGNGSKGYTFQNSNFEKIGILNTEGGTLSQTFYNAKNLVFIELIVVYTETTTFNSTFYGCTKLAEIRFDGTIGKAIDFKSCPLSVESMKSIIGHLKNYTGTGKENTTKVSFSDACWSALEADSTAPNGGTWKEYVQFTLCWNV